MGGCGCGWVGMGVWMDGCVQVWDRKLASELHDMYKHGICDDTASRQTISMCLHSENDSAGEWTYSDWLVVLDMMVKTTSVFYTWSVFQDEKKKFDKASERYYAALEKHLAISSKKKDFMLAEVRREVGLKARRKERGIWEEEEGLE